jgi:hypothetical protein
MGRWTVDDAEEIVLEGLTEVNTALIGGDVAVTVADGPARLEVKRIDGDPVDVRFEDGVLTIFYERDNDFSWPSFGSGTNIIEEVGDLVGNIVSTISLGEKFGRSSFGHSSFGHRGRSFGIHFGRRFGSEASVALTVPPTTKLHLRSVSASAVVAGIEGEVEMKSASGDLTLDGVSGSVRMKSMSGDLEGQGLQGDLKASTASGDVTLVKSACNAITVNTVSGDITLECALADDATFDLKSVSGDVALWLPGNASADVEAVSVSGRVDAATELEVEKAPGRRRVTGHIGSGEHPAQVRVKTVSGDLTVLRRTEAVA